MGFTQFPCEIFRAPRSWVQTVYANLIHFNKVDKGGHFAAWEEPDLFAAEMLEHSPAATTIACPVMPLGERMLRHIMGRDPSVCVAAQRLHSRLNGTRTLDAVRSGRPRID